MSNVDPSAVVCEAAEEATIKDAQKLCFEFECMIVKHDFHNLTWEVADIAQSSIFPVPLLPYLISSHVSRDHHADNVCHIKTDSKGA